MIILMVLDYNGSNVVREIYERNKAKLLVTARSYLGDRAEDAVHDAFVKLIERYEGKLQELQGKDPSYFIAVVKNHSLDILKLERKELPVDEDDAGPIFTVESPEAEVELADELERMKFWLDRLKPQYRQALEYKYILGYSNAEIAEELSISPQTVYKRLDKAISGLKALMEGGLPVDE